MKRESRRWVLGMVAAAMILALATGALYAHLVHAEQPKTPPAKELPGVIIDAVTGTVRPITPGGDSIYAAQITIDASGITIIDRTGRVYRLIGPKGEIEVPDLPDVGVIVIPEPCEDLGEAWSDTGRVDRVHLGTDLVIEADEVITGDAVCIFGNLTVRGRVNGSAVSVFGSVDVEGTVDHEAVAPFGEVQVASTGSVGRGVVASKITRDPGGRISGSRQEIFLSPFQGERWASPLSWAKPTYSVLVFLKVVFWLFLVLLAYALAARNINKVTARIRGALFKSLLIGIVAQILFVPAVALLVVTIVGIPVALFVLPVMVFVALVLAQAAAGLYMGDILHDNAGVPLRAPLSRMLVGVIALQSFALLSAVAIWGAGGSEWGTLFRVVTFASLAASILLGYIVITIGTGAVISTRFGTRPREAIPPPAAPEPDLPGATPLPVADTNPA